ncbi:MAG: alpha/beta hydrolase [Monoglobales bacterium]
MWTNEAVQNNGIAEPEETKDGLISNISKASIKIWPAENGKADKAVLICPGGSYVVEAAEHEGSLFADWLAKNGITGIVLKYRLPNGHSEIPLADAKQAIKTIRAKAKEWNINSEKIGVMGFSAGGHLASTLLTHYDEDSRPDFGLLVYPVISMGEFTHDDSRKNLLGEKPTNKTIRFYSNELQVTTDTPPTMLLFSDDDTCVDPHNGIMFYDALKQNKVQSAIYIFPTGGHGWGFAGWFEYHEQMKTLMLDWIRKF